MRIFINVYTNVDNNSPYSDETHHIMSTQPIMAPEAQSSQVSTPMQVIAWIVLIIGIVIAGLGVLSLFGVITPFLVRIFGGIVAIALGAVLGVWGAQTLRGQKAPFQKPVQDASEQLRKFVQEQQSRMKRQE